jgi:ComF family protein
MYGFTHPNCRRQLGLDGAQSVFQYNPLFRKLIKNFKYRSAHKIFTELKQVILPCMLQKIYIPKSAYLNPIPLHPLRQKERGFNQANFIADYFATYFHLSLTQLLTRVKETKAQAQLTKPEDRVANMRNAFEILENSYVPQTVIVVDDVFTTGSTLGECTRILKNAGAKTVKAFTLARG